MPEKELDPCWWIVNDTEEDKSKEPTFLCRSLVCLRLELKQTRCATSAKLRQCYQQRAEENARVVDVLHNNIHLWKYLGGPDPELLFRPCRGNLERCWEASEAAGALRKSEADRDGIMEFTDEIMKAVGSLTSLEWEDIRVERFNMTPPALFQDMVHTAESLLHRQAAEIVV